MPLDSGLLAQARAAAARVINAERDAEAARTDFHQAIRRLQLAGGSLREIAEECGLSHQRIHQIVEATGGSRSFCGGQAGSGEPLSCSFCGRQQKQVNKLIAGPHARICDRCVGLVHTVVATGGTPGGAIRRVSDASRDEKCSFCAKSRHQAVAMAAAGEARICDECLDLCDEIIRDEPI